jgi:hypothetical protein
MEHRSHLPQGQALRKAPGGSQKADPTGFGFWYAVDVTEQTDQSVREEDCNVDLIARNRYAADILHVVQNVADGVAKFILCRGDAQTFYGE